MVKTETEKKQKTPPLIFPRHTFGVNSMNITILFHERAELSFLKYLKTKPFCLRHSRLYYNNQIFIGMSLPCQLGLQNILTTPLQRKDPPPPNKYPGYKTKLSDGEAPVLELWKTWSTPLLCLLLSPLSSGVVVPVRVPCMG